MMSEVVRLRRFSCFVIYDGGFFGGWEGNDESVKIALERALKMTLGNRDVSITCAGRTDRGVHALGQRIHFDISTQRTPLSLEKGINFYLKEINPRCQVYQCESIEQDFNARFSAKSRCYRYYLMDRKNILLDKFAVAVRGVDWKVIEESCGLLEGYYDISCFCPKKYDGRRMRTVLSVSLKHEVFLNEKLYFIQVEALGFAHHQVRFMVGALLHLGQGIITKNQLLSSIKNKKRIYLAPARGLFLFSVNYKG
jgi:tRNA pseudouridine(38-40) synthase